MSKGQDYSQKHALLYQIMTYFVQKRECNGFFPLLPNTTGHLLCFLKFRLFIHVWIPRFPRRRKRRWHLYRSTERWSVAIWWGRDHQKTYPRLKPVAFPLTQVCVIDINPKLQTMRAKAVDSSTHVCKKMWIWYLMYSSKHPTQHYIPIWAQWM